MHYDHRLRPAPPPTPPPDAFTVHRPAVPATPGRDGLTIAYVREGVGGYPLVLLHGYPETKRIWWRNIGPLAAVGYEVIVPDLRGFGDSDLSAADVYDLAAYSRDVYLLVHDGLGHETCGVVGGDVGGATAVDLVHRYPGFVDKLVFFDTVPPMVIDDYVAAGIDVASIRAIGSGPTADYRYRQGATPDELAAELDTEAKRRRYVGDMYGHRLWASPGTFDAAAVDFMTEPFATEERLRASWAVYQLAHGRPMSEPPLMGRKVDTPTLVLYGMDDAVVGPDFVHCCEVAFTDRTGPVVIPGAGHFLQWERADIFNPLVAAYFGDRRVAYAHAEGLGSTRPVIDTHVHVVSTDTARYPLRPNDPNATWFRDHPCPADEFLVLMDADGVERAVLVQAMGVYTDDNRYCLDATAAAPDRFAAVVYVDAASPGALDALTAAAERGAVGVRIVASTRPGSDGFDAPRIGALWAHAASLRLRIVATTLAPGLPGVVPLLEAHPDTPVAIDHCGFPDLSGGRPFPAARPLFELARFPHVHVKVSTNALDLAVAAGATRADLVAELAAAYGPDRLQWGSNWSHTHDRPYGQLVAEGRAALAPLGPDAEAVVDENARGFWFSG